MLYANTVYRKVYMACITHAEQLCALLLSPAAVNEPIEHVRYQAYCIGVACLDHAMLAPESRIIIAYMHGCECDSFIYNRTHTHIYI